MSWAQVPQAARGLLEVHPHLGKVLAAKLPHFRMHVCLDMFGRGEMMKSHKDTEGHGAKDALKAVSSKPGLEGCRQAGRQAVLRNGGVEHLSRDHVQRVRLRPCAKLRILNTWSPCEVMLFRLDVRKQRQGLRRHIHQMPKGLTQGSA